MKDISDQVSEQFVFHEPDEGHFASSFKAFCPS